MEVGAIVAAIPAGYDDLLERPEEAVEIERLGYGAVWVGGSRSADLSVIEPTLGQTDSLTVATGIVNIWSLAAKPVADSYSPHRKDCPWWSRCWPVAW
jgi:hypothetical protein